MTAASTRLYGVLGWPVTHSVSPAMHTAAFRQLGHDAVYLALPVRPADLASALSGLGAAGAAGLNLTVPHKEAAVPLLSRATDLARALGAVNTLWPDEDGGWVGDNTDAPGLLRALRRARVRTRGRSAVVLGAGGAAAAAAFALHLGGARRILIVNRTEARAGALVKRLGPALADVELAAGPLTAPELGEAAVVVQATSVGLDGRSMIVDPKRFAGGATVVDLVYGSTPLLRAARRRGLCTVDGVSMLVLQGALSLEQWTRRRVGADTIAAMERAARTALRPRRGARAPTRRGNTRKHEA